MTTALETWRKLRGYTVTPVAPVEHQTITPVDTTLVQTTSAESVPDERAAKSTPTMRMPKLSGVNLEVWQRTYDQVLADTGDETKAYLAALGQVRRGQYGMATKARKEGTEVYVSGWAVMFGDPRITDTDHQYFADDTMFLLDFYKESPLWYDHGDDPAYGSMPIGQRVGYEVYKYGIWLVHKLFMDHPLIIRTLKALDNGELSYSSDSIWHYVRRGLKPDGKLSNWALSGCSLTPTPAELGLGLVFPQVESSEGEITESVV